MSNTISTVTLDWEPPTYEILNDNTIRICFYKEFVKGIVTMIDLNSKKEVEIDYGKWLCDLIEVEDSGLIQMIPDSIEFNRGILLLKIIGYSSSHHVNTFKLNGFNIWLDKETRLSLELKFKSDRRLGKRKTIFEINGTQFSLPPTDALNMLNDVEYYSRVCQNITQSHLIQAYSLSSTWDISNYDYTVDYPEELIF